ncbi:hypothetical protein [Pseudophaeobacter flagellatus]|uniref:hypothetical protein n=1 Tax=Pseudophaeobacter flagellatus TaxID=2899119 RepID=UPI001E4B2EEF|nr:hypothetical protein [Pseudophaeobacter flagellatus]MCD9148251.1 hypothetical protein [Pseudophaeobacter flagellatus]
MATSHGQDLPQEWQALGFTPGLSLRVFGMRRSGNHAILSWLQRNAPNRRSVFLNNCKPGSDPLQNARGIAVNGVHASQRKANRNMASVAQDAGDGALFLVSYEDTSPAEFDINRQVSGRFDEALFSHNLLIYRSFLNWSASLLKKMQANAGYTLVRRNAIVLRAMDNYIRLLALVRQARDLDLVAICYDRWVGEADYRVGLLQGLGLEAQDNSLGAVQSYGGGSSFQKQASAAADLQVGNRWQQMRDDAEYQGLLHLAARDTALLAQLEALFPKDASYLKAVAQDAPMPRRGPDDLS